MLQRGTVLGTWYSPDLILTSWECLVLPCAFVHIVVTVGDEFVTMG
jgi:hypothetical protein